jgi:hypothetical protein
MNYHTTLQAVRSLSENAVNHPIERRSRIAAYAIQLPAAKPEKRFDVDIQIPALKPPMTASGYQRTKKTEIQEDGGTFIHRVTGQIAFSQGRDPLHSNRIILSSRKQRFTCTPAELQLYWKASDAA